MQIWPDSFNIFLLIPLFCSFHPFSSIFCCLLNKEQTGTNRKLISCEKCNVFQPHILHSHTYTYRMLDAYIGQYLLATNDEFLWYVHIISRHLMSRKIRICSSVPVCSCVLLKSAQPFAAHFHISFCRNARRKSQQKFRAVESKERDRMRRKNVLDYMYVHSLDSITFYAYFYSHMQRGPYKMQ